MMADLCARVQWMLAYCYRKGHRARRRIKSLYLGGGCMNVCMCVCVCWWGWMKAETWDNHAHMGTTPSSCCISPRLSLLSSGFGVCYLQHSRKQTQGFKIQPPLRAQNQLPERWNSPITRPNDNCPESAMIWLTIQTTIGIAAAYWQPE